MLQRFWKPWFVYQPTQLVRRALGGFRAPSAGYAALRTSWGVPIMADPTRTIGRSIRTTGLYDLAVSELLARLIGPGDTVVDAGANIGYMSVLMSVVAGANGRVISFEPHPELFRTLEANIAATRKRWPIATTELHECALGDHAGTAELQLPTDFATNDGIGTLAGTLEAGGHTITVQVTTLDTLLADSTISVMKMDVEGFEAHVLRGAKTLLDSKRISHIVFEDHQIRTSEVVRILQASGYEVFSLGWSMRGLKLQPVEVGSLATRYEAPNFVATTQTAYLRTLCEPRGWRILNSTLTPHTSSPN